MLEIVSLGWKCAVAAFIILVKKHWFKKWLILNLEGLMQYIPWNLGFLPIITISMISISSQWRLKFYALLSARWFFTFTESKQTADNEVSPEITVMSYSRYCRYRCMLKRLENCEDKWLRYALVTAIGGFAASKENNRVYFCRDTFEHADLDDFELRCDHLGKYKIQACLLSFLDSYFRLEMMRKKY